MSTLARATAVVTIGVLLAGCGDDGNDLASARASDGGLEIEVVSRDDGTLPAPADEPAAPAETSAVGVDADDHTAEPATVDDHDATGADVEPDAADEHTDEAHTDDDDADDAVDDGHSDDASIDVLDDATDDAAGEAAGADDEAGNVADEPVDEGFVVHVEMIEFAYVADVDVLPMGEDITFRFVNTGAIPHEAMFGSQHQQEEFAAAGDHGDDDGHGGGGHHGDITALTLDAGGASDLVVRFEEPGEVWIGCHLPGHWDAGMFASFEVA